MPIRATEKLPGPDPELESLEADLLIEGLARRYGYDFRGYSRASLIRRIRSAVQRESLGTISALQERVLRDRIAAERFVQAMSVHVTAMFRDPDFFRAFRQHVVPVLRTYPFVRIWHAGCSTGEEAYSLAILLMEEGMYDRCRIYATDMSLPLLERARRGIFSLKVMRQYTHNYLHSGGPREFSSYYTTDQENAILRTAVGKNILFSQHNLATDHSFNEFHVILCRNVTIYFGRELTSRVHSLFHDSLSRFGILCLGKKETLRFTPHESAYEELSGGVRIYRRIQ